MTRPMELTATAGSSGAGSTGGRAGSFQSFEAQAVPDDDLNHPAFATSTTKDASDEQGLWPSTNTNLTEQAQKSPDRDIKATPGRGRGDECLPVTEASKVSWNDSSDPQKPVNWSPNRKWAAVLVASAFTLITPISSAIVAPSLPDMGRGLGANGDAVVEQMMLSIFVLAYAIGPLFLAPLSEVYGRIPIMQLANLFFLVFNLVCGFAQTTAQMLVFRFLAGIGGSAPLVLAGGIIADMYIPEQRGRAVALYSLAPVLGPAIGPIVGGFVTEYSTWRWSFWAVSIADALIQLLGLFFLQETYEPVLLGRKAARIRRETGNPSYISAMAPDVETSFWRKMRTDLIRPLRLLFTQPIVLVLGLYIAYLDGLMYLIISSFASLYTSPVYYNQSLQIGSLHYISIAVGYMLGMQLTSRLNDLAYVRQKERNDGKGLPEFRIPVLLPCMVLLPIGYFWFGWSAEGHVHWIMPDIGAVVFATATIFGFQGVQTYTIDAYTRYAASALAATSTLRNLAGFTFPMHVVTTPGPREEFAPAMYATLGYGWASSLLAFVSIGVGMPATLLLWRYGATLRRSSQYAQG